MLALGHQNSKKAHKAQRVSAGWCSELWQAVITSLKGEKVEEAVEERDSKKKKKESEE